MLTASPALAAGSQGSQMEADWQMNEVSGPMLDSSGNHHNSKTIMAGITRNGSVYHYNGQGSVIVKSQPSLQPDNRDFRVTVRLHVDQLGDQNFIQKGGKSNTRGQWKIEMSGKHVHCRIAGTKGVASVWFWGKGKALRWGYHTISCTKLQDRVILSFDGNTRTQKVVTGSVSTPRNITFGGKGWGCGNDCDYLHGDMDWATYEYLG